MCIICSIKFKILRERERDYTYKFLHLQSGYHTSASLAEDFKFKIENQLFNLSGFILKINTLKYR